MEKHYYWICLYLFWTVKVDCFFYIRSVVTGYVLDLADQNKCADARVIMCPLVGRTSQMWSQYNVSMLQNHFGGYFLDSKGGTMMGEQVIVWVGHGGLNQQWFFEADGTVKNGLNFALDVQDLSRAIGAPVISFELTAAENQKFQKIEVGTVSA